VFCANDAVQSYEGQTVSPLDLLNDSISVSDHGNRSSLIVPQKGVTCSKLEVVSRKIVGFSAEESSSGMTNSSIKSTYENTEKDRNVLSKDCVCCLNITSNESIRNDTDTNYPKCCSTMQNGRNSVRNISNATDPVNHLATNSAVNLAIQHSSWQSTSDSVN
jgi:hypothetical protein